MEKEPRLADQIFQAAIEAFVAEVNAGLIEQALSRLTDDVVIVEDIPPFRWAGPDAGGQWLEAMRANARKAGIEVVTMTLGAPMRLESEGAAGYAVYSAALRMTGDGIDLRADGMLSFVLRRPDEHWQISALTWSGPEPQPA